MPARELPEPGVYRYFVLIEGRPAYFITDWKGVEHPVRVVGEDEAEADVIAELDALLARMASRPSRRPAPVLRLL